MADLDFCIIQHVPREVNCATHAFAQHALHSFCSDTYFMSIPNFANSDVVNDVMHLTNP